MRKILVKGVMSVEPLVAEASASLHDVAVKMTQAKCSCLVVVSDMQPIGIVTERDLAFAFLRVLDGQSNANATVNEVMTRTPVCVLGTTSFGDALMLSRSRKLRHLPVINDENTLIGIVTQTNLLDVYAELIEKQARLESNVEELKLLSMEDALLRIGNRRAMEVDLAYSEAEAKRHQRIFAIALFDIDYFKKYNDHYGHQAGDEALYAVAQRIKQTLRDSDRVFRYGGEEILVLMPGTDENAAEKCAQRVREAVEQLDIPHADSPFSKLTISGGICALLNGGWRLMVAEADKALYHSKQRGRNQVTLVPVS